jgi:hypothetical protein
MSNWCYSKEGGWTKPPFEAYRGAFLESFLGALDDYPQVAAGFRRGRFSTLDRSITVLVPAGGTMIRAVSISGGNNALVFSRTISISKYEVPAGGTTPPQLPNTSDAFVAVRIRRKGGDVETEQSAASNVGAYGWSDFTSKMPEFCSGRDVEELELTNSGVQAVYVTLTYQLAMI